MLRLLTADLVLDEPDDFDLTDLPAVSRLVNWAGMLGSRVLLSSATLPPALVKALFEAYVSGRKIYQKAVGELNVPNQICCAWFDEYGTQQSDHSDTEGFSQAHHGFVAKRVEKLNQAPLLRKAKLLSISPASHEPLEVVAAIAEAIAAATIQLHKVHHQCHPDTGQQLSIGLVRMANINPLVAVAERLFNIKPLPGYHIHYCVYHSQHPLIVRSAMERQLDAVLIRHDVDKIWRVEMIQQILETHPKENHILVVLATPVAEVGRDHDYDWAIVEPSSMRSLIQLAGRVQRHRQQVPENENIVVLAKNYRALCGEKIAYKWPGFEDAKFIPLAQHDLHQILTSEQLKYINATARIQERVQLEPDKNLVDLEHAHLQNKLFGTKGFFKYYAAQWWRSPIDWSGEMQRQTKFRKNTGDEQFFLYFEEENEEEAFYILDTGGRPKLAQYAFHFYPVVQQKPGIHFWGNQPFNKLIMQYAESQDMLISKVCLRFGEIRLRPMENNKKWSYHPMLGFFSPIN